MPVISGGNVIEGGAASAPIISSAAPVAGTDEVQTLTIGGTPTGGTFTLTYDGHKTAPITWSNVNATLVAAVDAALEALANIGTGGVTCAVGTMTAGVGTITITFAGAGTTAKRAHALIVAGDNLMTGTSPTAAVAETTPGVNATGRGAPKGALLIDTANAILYMNNGSDTAPTWQKVGTQT